MAEGEVTRRCPRDCGNKRLAIDSLKTEIIDIWQCLMASSTSSVLHPSVNSTPIRPSLSPTLNTRAKDKKARTLRAVCVFYFPIVWGLVDWISLAVDRPVTKMLKQNFITFESLDFMGFLGSGAWRKYCRANSYRRVLKYNGSMRVEKWLPLWANATSKGNRPRIWNPTVLATVQIKLSQDDILFPQEDKNIED